MRDSYEQGGDPYRFVIVAIFVFSSMLAGMAFNPLTPIASTAILIFKIGGDTIGLTTSICQVATVVLSLPAVAFAGKFGPKFSAIIGTLLISIGFSLRILINESIFFVLIGQVLAGFGGPFINNIQSIVINQWFNKKERDLVHFFRRDY
jgi:MFS family permease